MKKPMSTIDPSRLLQMRSSILNQNQALQRAAGQGGIGAAEGGIEGGGGAPDFGAAINNALQQVNTQQAKASHITAAYERGDPHDIVSGMISRQKAPIGFETTPPLRNQLPPDYSDLQNIPAQPL